MNRTKEELAQDLLDSLSEACEVFAIQKEQADSAQAAAQSTYDRLQSSLERRLADLDGTEPQGMRPALSDFASSSNPFERLQETASLSRRWEQALSDSQSVL